MADWRAAKSMLKLRSQVDAAFPGRDKSSDGTKSSEEHQRQNPNSDHDPDENGVVTAIDITNDPAHGLNSRTLAETLRLSHDPRIKYIISNNQIVSSIIKPWVWRPYSGDDPHTGHMHLSVIDDGPRYVLADDEKPWEIATPVASPNQQNDIIATEFGGSNDRQFGAYDGKLIGNDVLGVALPFRFEGTRPKVRVTRNGKSIIADIIDIGPWYDGRPGWPIDPYWQTHTRPRAESDPRTNHAGIDLTVGLAKALSLGGKGVVDWEFVSGEDVHDIRWMQKKLGVNPDGIVGPLTISAMIKHLEGEEK